MTLTELQSLAGDLTNDPNHDRYSLAQIATELDNAQGQWNTEIKIIKSAVNLTTVNGTRQYTFALNVSGTPISVPRVTHKGIDLKKRSKSYFDLYTNSDWTAQIGTPTDFFIEATDPVNLALDLYPTPQAGDAGNNLVVEIIMAHTPMSASTDVPFLLVGLSNNLLRPYDFYLAYSAAARLLARDPSDINNAKAVQYREIAREGKELLTNVFKNLEAEEPIRLAGGRRWVY